MPTYVLNSSSISFVATGFGGLESPFSDDFQPNVHGDHIPTRFDPSLDMNYIWLSVADAMENIFPFVQRLGGTLEILRNLAGFPHDRKDWRRISTLCRAL